MLTQLEYMFAKRTCHRMLSVFHSKLTDSGCGRSFDLLMSVHNTFLSNHWSLDTDARTESCMFARMLDAFCTSYAINCAIVLHVYLLLWRIIGCMIYNMYIDFHSCLALSHLVLTHSVCTTQQHLVNNLGKTGV